MWCMCTALWKGAVAMTSTIYHCLIRLWPICADQSGPDWFYAVEHSLLSSSCHCLPSFLEALCGDCWQRNAEELSQRNCCVCVWIHCVVGIYFWLRKNILGFHKIQQAPAKHSIYCGRRLLSCSRRSGCQFSWKRENWCLKFFSPWLNGFTVFSRSCMPFVLWCDIELRHLSALAVA